MKEELLRRLSREAKARQLTRAALMREACQHYLEKLREHELVRQYVEGYKHQPETAVVGKSGERLAATVWPHEDW